MVRGKSVLVVVMLSFKGDLPKHLSDGVDRVVNVSGTELNFGWDLVWVANVLERLKF